MCFCRNLLNLFCNYCRFFLFYLVFWIFVWLTYFAKKFIFWFSRHLNEVSFLSFHKSCFNIIYWYFFIFCFGGFFRSWIFVQYTFFMDFDNCFEYEIALSSLFEYFSNAISYFLYRSNYKWDIIQLNVILIVVLKKSKCFFIFFRNE